MKKILFILLSTLIISCGKQVNCNGNNEKQVLFKVLSTDFEKTYTMLKDENDSDFTFNLPYEDVKNDFFLEVVKLEGVRPSKIEKELKKCYCETKITLQLPKEMIDYVEKNLTKLYSVDLEKLKKIESIENLEYSLQLTEDDRIYCVTQNPNVLLEWFTGYAYGKNLINNHKNGLLKEINHEPIPEEDTEYESEEQHDYIKQLDFDKFKTEEYNITKKAKLDFSSNENAKYFKTRIIEAYKSDEIGFASYYIEVIFGCGADCISGFIVDVRDGKIYDLPLGEDYYCYPSEDKAVFEKNSRLFISNICRENNESEKIFYDASLWNESKKTFEKIDGSAILKK